MITLDAFKTECTNFLSTLKEFNAQSDSIDDNLIKQFYDMINEIAECMDQKQMIDGESSSNKIEPTQTDDVFCDICNLYAGRCACAQDIAILMNSKKDSKNSAASKINGSTPPSSRSHLSAAADNHTFCGVCDINISGSSKDFDIHVRGKRHRNKSNATKSNSAVSPSSTNLDNPKQNNSTSPINAVGKIQSNSQVKVICRVCNVCAGCSEHDIAMHIKSKKHLINCEATERSSTPSTASGPSNLNKKESIDFFPPRNSVMNASNVIKAIEIAQSIIQNQMFESGPSNRSPIQYKSNHMDIFCDVCKAMINGEKNYAEHLKGKRHRENDAAKKQSNVSTIDMEWEKI